jgi:hypothetical protein
MQQTAAREAPKRSATDTQSSAHSQTTRNEHAINRYITDVLSHETLHQYHTLADSEAAIGAQRRGSTSVRAYSNKLALSYSMVATCEVLQTVEQPVTGIRRNLEHASK